VTSFGIIGVESLGCSRAMLRLLVAGSPASSLGQVMWDLWRTKRHWGRFRPSTSVSPASHSTDWSTLSRPNGSIRTKGAQSHSLQGKTKKLVR
jgi:hypothetical protein